MSVKREKWRVLKFVVAASTRPEDIGSASYTLLRPYPKASFISYRKFCEERLMSRVDVEDIYVDIKTRKLWKTARDNIKDFDRFAIEEALEQGIALEPYDPNVAARMIKLKSLQENLVDWWCK